MKICGSCVCYTLMFAKRVWLISVKVADSKGTKPPLYSLTKWREFFAVAKKSPRHRIETRRAGQSRGNISRTRNPLRQKIKNLEAGGDIVFEHFLFGLFDCVCAEVENGGGKHRACLTFFYGVYHVLEIAAAAGGYHRY